MTRNARRREQAMKKAPCRTETEQTGLFAGTPGDRTYGNGFHCQARNDRIDTAVCIIQQCRGTDKCVGCGRYRD